MSGPTITVHMDKPCRRCKKKGTTISGYCLKCVKKLIDCLLKGKS